MPNATTFLGGYALYKDEVDEGTAVTPDASCGKVVGGEAYVDEGLARRVSVGGQVQVRPGPVDAALRLEIEIGTQTFAEDVLRASYPNGAIQSRTIDVGVDVANAGLKFSGAKINTLNGAAALEAALRYSLEIMAWTAVLSGGQTAIHDANETLEWFEAAALIASSAYYVQAVNWTVRNNLKRRFHLDSKGATVLRLTDGIIPGIEEVEASCEMLSPYGPADLAGVVDGTVADIALSCTYTEAAGGGNDIAHQFANMKRGRLGFALDSGDGWWVQKLDLTGIPGSFTFA